MPIGIFQKIFMAINKENKMKKIIGMTRPQGSQPREFLPPGPSLTSPPSARLTSGSQVPQVPTYKTLNPRKFTQVLHRASYSSRVPLSKWYESQRESFQLLRPFSQQLFSDEVCYGADYENGRKNQGEKGSMFMITCFCWFASKAIKQRPDTLWNV